MNPVERYEEITRIYRLKQSQLKKQVSLLSVLRLLVFLFTLALVYFFFSNAWVVISSILLGSTAFLFCVRLHTDAKKALRRTAVVADSSEFESAFLAGSDVHTDLGAEFLNTAHSFASDLNIFGKNSLYQYLSRCQTSGARYILAAKLQENLTDKAAILYERELAKAFSQAPEFVLNFRALCSELEESVQRDVGEEAPLNFKFGPFQTWIFTRILPFAMVLLTGAYAAGFIDWGLFSWCLLLPAGAVLVRLSVHQRLFTQFESQLKAASAYEELLELLRNFDTRSDALLTEFRHRDLNSSAIAIQELKRISNAIDSRGNIFVGIALNLLLLWDFQCASRLLKWNRTWGSKLGTWTRLVHEMEVYMSFSTYIFNHPDFTYPEFSEEFNFTIEEVSHVILRDKAIKNSLKIQDELKFAIITGANMAGKSTFLRTIGTSLVLAMRGLPVAASYMKFRPTLLFTSMLTSDSLGEGESYFFSELKRLRQLNDILEKGEPLFVILDEILKGTNSVDKAQGSKLFMEKMINLPAKGLIATHDLSLCELEAEFPQMISNFSFEVEFQGDSLHFDYKLRKGVCKNMNAKFLLQKMGLTNVTEP